MALPAQRVNLAPNPRSVGTAYSPNDGTTSSVAVTGLSLPTPTGITTATRGMKLSGTGAMIGSWFNLDGQTNSGTVRSIGAWFRPSVTGYRAHFSGTGATMTPVTLTPNVWTWVALAGYSGYVGAYVTRTDGASANLTDLCYVTGVTCEVGTTAPTSNFDGSTVETGWTHAWTGTVNASTSTRDVYGVWPEQSVEAGAPKVQVTAIGLGVTSVTTQIVREAGGETWTVPGWKKKNTLGGATFTDFAPPLGRPVTYTLFVDGNAVSSRTITVTSTKGWVSSPTQPDLAMPISLDGDDPNMLALAKPSLKDYRYASHGEEEYPMGGRYPIARSAPRGGAEGLSFVMNARTDAVSDTFQTLMASSPILLFRGLPSWGSIPPLAYLKGDVVENPFNRDVGQGFTQWTAEGKLVAPVATAPISGLITNAMVATNLAGRTHSSIAAASGTKRHIDIAANPLGLGA